MITSECNSSTRKRPKLKVTVINSSMEGASSSGSSLSLDWETFSTKCKIRGESSNNLSACTSPSPLSPNRTYQDRLILPFGTKEIEFTVPQTLSPLTPRKGINSGESSPGSLSGSRSETEQTNSRANSPSPIFFRSSATDISGTSNFCGLNPELYKANPDTEEDDKEYPVNHLGRVWYALEYETTSERLLVTLIKARNLQESRNSSGILSCNPSVRIALFPDERRTLLSKRKKMTCHPQFNETFGFQISKAALNERSIKFAFYDTDEDKRNSIIGYISKPLKDVDWSFGKQMFKEDLSREIGEVSPNISEVLVSLCYNGNISRLTCTIFEARGIKSKESASGLCAKISLAQNTKVVKNKKSDIVALLGCRANFNESFHFKMGPEMLDTASITIQLMYSQPGYNKGIGQDQSAGRIVVGSFMFARGKGLDHWSEMLAKQKEQIQYWHPISE